MKNFIACAAVLFALFLLPPLMPAQAAAPCDCQKELQRLENTRTDAERLEAAVEKAAQKFAAAERAVEAQYKGDSASRQLQGTIDLMNRAAKKGVDVNAPELKRNLEEAKAALKKERDEERKASDKRNALRQEKEALEAKLKAAQDATAKAEDDYRDCRHRCTGEKEEGKEEKPIEIIMVLPDPNDPDSNAIDVKDLMPRCTACTKAEDALLRAKEAFEKAGADRDSAKQKLDAVKADMDKFAAENAHVGPDLREAQKILNDMLDDFIRLGAKDINAISAHPEAQEAARRVEALHSQMDMLFSIWSDHLQMLDDAEKAFDKAERRLKQAEAELNAVGQALEDCNKTCKREEGFKNIAPVDGGEAENVALPAEPAEQQDATVCAYVIPDGFFDQPVDKRAAEQRKASDALGGALKKRIAAEAVVTEKYRKERQELDKSHYHIGGGGMSEVDYQAALAKLKSEQQAEDAPLHAATTRARACLGDYMKALSNAAKAGGTEHKLP